MKNGTRFPKSVKIQGTKNIHDYYDLISQTGPLCTTTDKDNECLTDENQTFNVQYDRYKGFRIVLNGEDSRNTYQLCIYRFEIYGSFYNPITCKKFYFFDVIKFILIDICNFFLIK